ncbi:MAG: hypothetical protein ACR2PT_20500 [Endozoicomonas sp.]
MDNSVKKQLLAAAIASILSLSLAGCGGGGGSESPANSSGSGSSGNGSSDSEAQEPEDDGSQTEPPPNPDTNPPTPSTQTTFNIEVDAPDGFNIAALSPQGGNTLLAGLLEAVIPSAHAAAVASATIKVAIVDANGLVTEIVEADAVDNGDGTYEVTLEGDPRIDCLIIAGLPNQNINLQVGEPVPEGALFAPTSETDIDINTASTIATRLLLEAIDSFDGVTLEELNELIDDFSDRDYGTIDDSVSDPGLQLQSFLGQARQRVYDDIVEQVNNIQTNPAGAEAVSSVAGDYFFDVYRIGVGKGLESPAVFAASTIDWPGVSLQVADNNKLTVVPADGASFKKAGIRMYDSQPALFFLQGDEPRVSYEAVLSKNGALTIPLAGYTENQGEFSSYSAPGSLKLYPVVGGAFVGTSNWNISQFDNNQGNTLLSHEIDHGLSFMAKLEGDFSGEIKGSYGIVQLGFLGLNPDLEEANPLFPALSVISNTNLWSVTGDTVVGAGTTEWSSTSFSGRSTMISGAGVFSAAAADDLASVIEVTSDEKGKMIIRSEDEGEVIVEPEAQLSANGQMFWQKGFEDLDNEFLTAISIGLRTDTGATLSSLEGKRFRVTGVEFFTETDGTSIELETGVFSATELRFESGELVLDGAIRYLNAHTGGELPWEGMDSLKLRFQPSLSNGRISAARTEDDETISIIGYVGTDEDSVAGSDALVLTLTSNGKPDERGLSSEDITHSILIATPI